MVSRNKRRQMAVVNSMRRIVCQDKTIFASTGGPCELDGI